MRKILAPALLAGTLSLGGCATAGGGLLGDLLGGGYGGGSDLSRFERAGANACGQEASRYGRVQIGTVGQTSRDIVRVNGRVDTRNRGTTSFDCEFRSDGQIVNFRIG